MKDLQGLDLEKSYKNVSIQTFFWISSNSLDLF